MSGLYKGYPGLYDGSSGFWDGSSGLWDNMTGLGEFLLLNPRVAFLGDSLYAQGNVGVSGAPRLSSLDINDVVMAQALDPRFKTFTWANAADARFYIGDNYGIGGNTTADGLARVSTVLAYDPDVVCVGLGTNDVVQSIAAATSAANLISICKALFAGGVKRIVLDNVPPVTSTYATPNNALRLQLNALIADIAASDPRIVLDNRYSALVQANGFALAADMNADGLHLGPKGGLKLGIARAAAFTEVAANSNYFDTLWALPNLLGTRGTLQGTGGTIVAPNTGTLAAGHVLTRTGNSSVAASLVANTTYSASGQTQILTVTPSGAGTSELFTFGSNPNALTVSVANQWAMYWAEVEIDNWGFWFGPTVKMGYAPFDANRFVQGPNYQVVIVPIGPRRLYICTPPYLLDGSATGIMPSIITGFVANGATGTGTLRINRQWAGVIPDPSA